MAHFGFRNRAFPQESDITPKDPGLLLGMCCPPLLPSTLGLCWSRDRLYFPSGFIIHMRGGLPQTHIIMWKHTGLKPWDLNMMHPLMLLLRVGAGAGGGEALPIFPTVYCFSISFLSPTAPPLKKGNSWACPTRDEEETLNLNPGNVYSFGGPEVDFGIGEETFHGKGASLSFLVLQIGLLVCCF